MRNAYVLLSTLAAVRVALVSSMAAQVGTRQGHAAGFVLGVLEFTGLMAVLRWERGRGETALPISVYGLPRKSTTLPSRFHGKSTTSRRDFDQTALRGVRRDQEILAPLASMILNEYGGGERIPREGVRLTWRACRKYGMTRARWNHLRRYVEASGLGYLTTGTGGKQTTVLRYTKAREFIDLARVRGMVGGVRK